MLSCDFRVCRYFQDLITWQVKKGDGYVKEMPWATQESSNTGFGCFRPHEVVKVCPFPLCPGFLL